MRLVLNVDDTPPVLAATDWLTVNHHVPLRPDNGERHHTLRIDKSPRQKCWPVLLALIRVGRTLMAWFSCRSSASFSSVSNG